MTTDPHIVTSFDDELRRIEGLVLEMSGLVEAQIQDCVTCLFRQDLELVQKVKASDKQVDRLELEIGELAIQILAQRQPLAQDLRGVVSVLKIAGNVERIGDYAKNIAKRSSTLGKTPPVDAATATMKRMSATVQEMVRGVIDAYVARDLETADLLRDRDEEVDLMHNSLFRELLTYMMEDPRNISPCMHLLFIAKNFERMGDHATNIAEQVHYLVSGTLPGDDRPKSDKTSYIAVDSEAS
ncbi:MAG: phosphate signaling complex protein PhoU [Pseudomonadota bacterium]